MNKHKISGKDPLTEVLIKKKLDFYKEKQRRRGKDEKKYAEIIKITTADKLSIVWNPVPGSTNPSLKIISTNGWHSLPLASSVSNNITTKSTAPSTSTTPDTHQLAYLDNVDEEAPPHPPARDLLSHHRRLRIIRSMYEGRLCTTSWFTREYVIPGVAIFETSVLVLKAVEEKERRAVLAGVAEKSSGGGSMGLDVVEKENMAEATCRDEWEKGASEKLDIALSLAPSTVDLSSRLDSTVTMLRDEIMTKREMLGIL